MTLRCWLFNDVDLKAPQWWIDYLLENDLMFDGIEKVNKCLRAEGARFLVDEIYPKDRWLDFNSEAHQVEFLLRWMR
jgi:hypothetical protein